MDRVLLLRSPSGTSAVFHSRLYGDVVSVTEPPPGRSKRTEAMPSASEALTRISLLPDTVAPLAGVRIESAGGRLPPLFTLSVIAEVVVAPALSVAATLMV